MISANSFRLEVVLGAAILWLSGSLAAHAGDLTGRVTAGGRPVRDAVLFVDELRTAPAERRARMDQVDRTFIPHVMAVQLGTP